MCAGVDGAAQALTIMRNRRFSTEHLEQLAVQLDMYHNGAGPFNKASGGKNFNVRQWFETLPPATAGMVINLGTLLLDIVPHAADTERTISIHRWFDAPRRNRATTTTQGRMVKVKLHLAAQRPKAPPRRLRADKRSGKSSADTTDTATEEADVEIVSAADGGGSAAGSAAAATNVAEADTAEDTEICGEEDLEDLLAALNTCYEEDLADPEDAALRVDVPVNATHEQLAQALEAAWGNVDIRNDLWDPNVLVEAVEVPDSRALGSAAPGDAETDINNILRNLCGFG
jgi:uncharacterized protein YecT (DUF1311 family)